MASVTHQEEMEFLFATVIIIEASFASGMAIVMPSIIAASSVAEASIVASSVTEAS